MGSLLRAHNSLFQSHLLNTKIFWMLFVMSPIGLCWAPIYLNIKLTELKRIELQHGHDIERCKLEMVHHWKQNDPTANWRKLRQALHKWKALKCWCLGGGKSLVHMHNWMHYMYHTAWMHASNNETLRPSDGAPRTKLRVFSMKVGIK